MRESLITYRFLGFIVSDRSREVESVIVMQIGVLKIFCAQVSTLCEYSLRLIYESSFALLGKILSYFLFNHIQTGLVVTDELYRVEVLLKLCFGLGKKSLQSLSEI